MTPSNRRIFLKDIVGLALAAATPAGPIGCSSGKKHTQPDVYVIAEPCIGDKCGDCVSVCPVDCIHPQKNEVAYSKVDQLFINPRDCIACGECVWVCPVDAIFEAHELPKKWQSFIQENTKFFGLGKQ